MPITPLHYPFVYLISKISRKFSLPGLIVGSVIPDIEVPIMWIFFTSFPDHLFLHSLVGALTIGTLLTMVVTSFLYPQIITFVFKFEKDELNQVLPTYDIWTAYFIASSITHVAMIVIWSGIIMNLHSKGDVWYRHWVVDARVTKHIASEVP